MGFVPDTQDKGTALGFKPDEPEPALVPTGGFAPDVVKPSAGFLADTDIVGALQEPEGSPLGEQVKEVPRSLLYGAIDAGIGTLEGAQRGLGNLSRKFADNNRDEYNKIINAGGDTEGWRAKAFKGLENFHRAVQDYWLEYEGGWVIDGGLEASARRREKVKEALAPTTQGFITDVARGVGGMATLPLDVSGAGVLTIPGQMFDEGYQQAIAEGKTEDEALDTATAYAFLGSPVEALGDVMLRKFGGKATVRGVKKIFQQSMKKLGLNFVSEGSTEVLQDAILNKLNGNQAFTPQSLRTFLVAGTVGTIAGGGSVIVDQKEKNRRVKYFETMGLSPEDAVRATDLTVEGKIDEAIELISANRNLKSTDIIETAVKADADNHPLSDKDVNRLESLVNKEQLTDNEQAELDALTMQLDESEQDIIYDTLSTPEEQAFADDAMRVFARLRNQQEVQDGRIEREQETGAIETDTEAREAQIDAGRTGVQEVTGEAEQRVDVGQLEGLQESMQADKAEEQQAPPKSQVDSRTVGLSKEWDKAFNVVFEEQGLPEPDKIRQTETIRRAFSKGLHRKTDELIKKTKKRRTLTHEEVGGLLIRKTEIFSEIKRLQRELAKTTDEDKISDLSAQLDAQLDLGTDISEAIRVGAEDIARALAAVNMKLDMQTYDLVSVMSRAKKASGRDVTQEESDSLKEKQKEWQDLSDEIEKVESGELDEREALLDEIERVHRRMNKKGRKKADKNADLKLMKRRQDMIFALIEEINRRKPAGQKIKKEKPDSAGYLDMINNLRNELKQQKAEDAKVQRNIKLIDKRDALISEVENMHRDLEAKSEKLKKSKLEKDIALYNEAKRDQDMIAQLLSELRGDAKAGNLVTKDDVFGYKQTIKNLRQKISDKKSIEKLDGEISAMESAIAEGDIEYTGKQAEKSREFINKELEARKKTKSELSKKLKDMKADRDRLDRKESEAIELLDNLENLSRRIRTKKQTGEDVNADLKLAIRRQDAIIKAVDEINNKRPTGEKIEKVEKPDSEGYLEMLQNVRKELSDVRKERRLDDDIAQMEADLESGDLSRYDKKKEPSEEPFSVILKRARKNALQKEIDRQIADMKPWTIGRALSDTWDVFRNLRLTADAGHLLRQGGVVTSNPRMWKSGDVKQFYKESIKALNKENADILDANIMSHKNYDKWKLAGLALIEEGGQLDAREEILMHGLLSKAPVVGKAQQAFGRTQISGTNLIRLLAAESYLGGKDVSMQEMKEIAKAVNVLTGRGASVRDPKVNNILNKVLTSPSFTASRFQAPFLLAHKVDGKYLWQNKNLRKRIIEDSAWFVGTRMAIMAAVAAAFPDIEFGDDEDHWTYGRLIVPVGGGQVRVYDPWAGILSAYRALYPLSEGDTGETLKRVFEGRKHPALSSLEEIAFGKTPYGGEIDRRAAVLRSVLPISVEGMREAVDKDTGVLDLLASTSMDISGVGSILMDERDLRKSRREAARK